MKNKNICFSNTDAEFGPLFEMKQQNMYYGISITHEDEHFVCKNTELILDDNLKSSNCLIPPFFVKKTVIVT